MKFPYFKLKDAWDDVRGDFTYGDKVDKVASIGKLLGKTVANVGMLSAEMGVEIIKALPDAVNKEAERRKK